MQGFWYKPLEHFLFSKRSSVQKRDLPPPRSPPPLCRPRPPLPPPPWAQGWDWAADEFPTLLAYLHRMTGRPSWRNTASYDDESLAADLGAKLRQG